MKKWKPERRDGLLLLGIGLGAADSFGDISDTNQEFYAGGDASAEAGNENKI